MRVLYFIEPVVFRGDPFNLKALLPWADLFRGGLVADGDTVAVASNTEVCEEWIRASAGTAGARGTAFELDAYEPLRPFQYRRDRYAWALYADRPGPNPLADELRRIIDQFQPELVVSSSQNAFVSESCGATPTFFVEQAPLPRASHPSRIVLDPAGHQSDRCSTSDSASPAPICR